MVAETRGPLVMKETNSSSCDLKMRIYIYFVFFTFFIFFFPFLFNDQCDLGHQKYKYFSFFCSLQY